MASFKRTLQYYKFSAYGFLKNLQFYDPFILLFFLQNGLSYLYIGILFSIREIITNIMEIPSGMIADTLGRRRAMVFSFASYILSFLVFYFFSSFAAFIPAMVLFGIGEAFRTGTHKAMIIDYLDKNNMLNYKVDYYGNTRAWSQIGSAVSALAAAAFVFYSGNYRIVFLLTCIPYVLDLLLFLSYPRELDGLDEQADFSFASMGQRFKDSFTGLFVMLKDAKTRRALINSSLFDGVFKSVKDYVQPILKRTAFAMPVLLALSGRERTAILTGLVYALLYVLNSFASRYAGTLNRKIASEEKAINGAYIGGLALSAAAGLFLFAGFNWVAIILFLLFFLVMNLRRPMTVGYVSSLIKSRIMATGLSGESQAKTLVVAVVAPIMGFLADTIGLGPALAALSGIPLILYPFVRLRRDV